VKKARFAFKLGGGAKTNKRKPLLFSRHNENIFCHLERIKICCKAPLFHLHTDDFIIFYGLALSADGMI
jgi:hypothetical protein